MEQVPLIAQKRTVLGRKVKKLRKEGLLPAHVFGHKVKTIHIQVNNSDFNKVFEKVGETGLIDLSIDKDKRPVMVRNVQLNPVTDDALHVDFYQVNLSEKVKVNVPLEIVGQSPAVEKKTGLLLTPVSEVEIEALPTDIPEKIEVDISNLLNIGDEIKIKDLKLDRTKIELLSDEELVVAQIGELVTKEMEETEAEIAAEQTEAAEGEAEGKEAKEAEDKEQKDEVIENKEVKEEKPQKAD
jgi:large subunit ribosomal protein L25